MYPTTLSYFIDVYIQKIKRISWLDDFGFVVFLSIMPKVTSQDHVQCTLFGLQK